MRSLMGLSGAVLLRFACGSDQLSAFFGAVQRGVALRVLAGVVFNLDSDEITVEVSSCVP